MDAPIPLPADASPLYLRLAAHYRRAIQSGQLPPGQRMPSVRALTRQHGVSLATAVQACHRLEDEGWLVARPRSGYFVQQPVRARMLPASEPDALHAPDPAQYLGIHDRVSDYLARCQRHPVRVNLAQAVAAPGAYPAEGLKHAAQRALRLHPDLLVRPAPVQGEPGFRHLLARRALAMGLAASAEDILVVHGNTEALTLALRAVAGPGDTVAVESPTYYGLLQVLESLGMKALEIPTSPHTGLSPEALELALRTQPGLRALVVMPNLQNPLGCSMPAAHKARLVEQCQQAGIALIEDDTYGPLADTPAPPAKAWDTEGWVIYCASLSKALAPGMRLGWMMGGRWHARLCMLKYAQSHPNETLGQMAAAAFMGAGAHERQMGRLRGLLRQQRERMADSVAQHFPAGTRLTVPEGGLLLWVELPPALSGQALFEAALREGIRIAPGHLFTNSHRYDHALRLSCGHPHTPEVEAALHTLGRLAAR